MSRPFSLSDRSEVYLDDENAVTLTFNARNEGEGGAYEAELHVVMPSDADYIGIARNNEVRHMMSRHQCTRFNNLLNKGCACWNRRAGLYQSSKTGKHSRMSDGCCFCVFTRPSLS